MVLFGVIFLLPFCGAEVPIHLPSMVYIHGCLRVVDMRSWDSRITAIGGDLFMQSQSIHEFCEGLMSFIDSNPESPCIVNLFGAKREIPKWMKDLGSELIPTSLGHAMDILKDKDRYNGKAGLYVEDRDNPEIPFRIPFINYGSIDADRITEDWRRVHRVR